MSVHRNIYCVRQEWDLDHVSFAGFAFLPPPSPLSSHLAGALRCDRFSRPGNRFGEVLLPCGPWDSRSTLRSCRSFVSSFPSRPQDSLRIEWLVPALPGFRLSETFDGDLHPVRDAKLCLAHSICSRSRVFFLVGRVVRSGGMGGGVEGRLMPDLAQATGGVVIIGGRFGNEGEIIWVLLRLSAEAHHSISKLKSSSS